MNQLKLCTKSLVLGIKMARSESKIIQRMYILYYKILF